MSTSSSTIVEADYAFGWIAQVGHDETKPGKKLPLIHSSLATLRGKRLFPKSSSGALPSET